MKVYKGWRNKIGLSIVEVDGRRLSPRFDLYNHSPTGFNWGYVGSGPAQLALALLADAVGDDRARKWYQDFKRSIVAALADTWSITSEQVHDVVKGFEQDTLAEPQKTT